MAVPTTVTTVSPPVGRADWRTIVTIAGPALLALVGVISPINDTDEPAERLADLFANAGGTTPRSAASPWR